MPNGSTEQNVQNSIEETGGIPSIEVSLQVSGMTQTPVDRTLSIQDMAADAKAVGDAIADVESAVSDNATAIEEIEAWTGEDIPVNSQPGAMSIAEVLAEITGDAYPVGSVYMTTSSNAPTFTGTWVEIGVTATWTQLKTGKRGYTELPEGESGGSLHFWLRTE